MSKSFKRITNLMMLLFISVAFPSFAQSTSINGTYKIVVTGYDWGPAVNRVILSLDSPIDKIDLNDLSVVESKNWYPKKQNEGFSVSSFNRTILNAYLSDENGNEVKKASKFLTLDLKVSPTEGSPFLYDFMVTQFNNWCDPYYLTIKLAENKSLVSGTNTITKINIDKTFTARIMPEADKFKMGKFKSDNITIDYASYSPKKDDKKNALIIWLNGLGEGGHDPYISLLGNKVTALASDETQKLLKNAYVLVPQSPTFWMDNGSGDISKFNGVSKYDKALMDLIKNFVDNNPDINKAKIIIGGCSNGGFMALRTVLLNPTYFSAAYPICEPYRNDLLTDDMIKTLKDVPMWFTFAINDKVVPPMINEVPTLIRLSDAGAKNLHISVFSNVKDTTGLYKNDKGTPYEYDGHWSWLYALNNECVEKGVSLFEWAEAQTNPNVK